MPNSVDSFLNDHPHLVDLYDEGKKRLRDTFGEAAGELVVQVKKDDYTRPEGELVVILHVDTDVDEALRLLELFDNEWWVEAGQPYGGQLLFDIRPARV